jgi:N-acyl-D-aspartate/D-glutamate deacylase
MNLEEAVRKITSSPARKFNLTDRGVLKKGGYADIVVWDAETITDKGSQTEPRQYPEGIKYVIVNGKFVIKDGVHTGALPGKILTRE